jgi:hypothetical protein
MAPEHEGPATIADAIGENLHAALAIGEELKAGLRSDDAALPEWVVYLAPDPIDLAALPVPALVRAVGRYAAEGDVAAVVGIPASRCFALPAYVHLRSGAVPLAEHPLRKKSLGEVDLADAFMIAMQRQIDRVDQDTAETMRVTASLLGCSVSELEARLEREEKERQEQKAARKSESKAQRQPAPKNAPAKRSKAPGEEATVADGMRTLTDRQRELLALVDVDQKTNRVVYTRDEHVPDWAALKQAVEALGGKWVGKGKKTKGGWAFDEDVDAMNAIRCALETGSIFDPTLLGFYPTSEDIADALAARLAIQPGDVVLEPSAGKGALALAVRRACPDARIVCVELVPEHQEELRAHGFEVIGGDFLALSSKGAPALGGPFTVICANPPFGKGRPELHHLRRMIDLLPLGGRLGAILPNGIQFREDALTVATREELARHGAEITDNPHGAFREAGTMISTVTMTLTKRT